MGTGAAGLAAGEQSRASTWAIAVCLIVAVAATYANALRNDFVFDDFLLIVENAGVRAPFFEGWMRIGYRPLRTLSYRLDYALGGMDPWIFHLSNLLHHGATVLLVLLVARLAGASRWAAGAGALVFAVHPVQADAVAYAAGRRDVLCGLLFVAGFAAYLTTRARSRWWGMLLVGGAWALALLAKEMAVTLPLVCWAFARFDAGRRTSGDRPRERVSWARLGWASVIVAVAVLLATTTTYPRFLRRVLAETPWHGGSVGANVATVARIWAHYLGLVVWPAGLTVDYSYDAFPVSTSVLDPRALAAAGILAVLALAARSAWRRGSLAGYGLAWTAVTLLPVSHVIPYVELLAEHYLYIPMVGIALVVAGAVDATLVRLAGRRWPVAVAVLLVAAGLASRTAVRTRDFRDARSLWTATVAVVPDCARARFNLGQVHMTEGRHAEAERTWRAGAVRFPEAFPFPLALAKLAYRQGDYARARKEIKRALAIRPRDGGALTLAGWISLHGGAPARARRYFEVAVARLGRRAEDARIGLAAARAVTDAPGEVAR